MSGFKADVDGGAAPLSGPPRIIGLDIGGANLKAATASGRSISRAFEIWRTPELLGDALWALLADFLPADALAVTLTAELADCFSTKAEGVSQILDTVERVAGTVPVHVWSTQGEFLSPSAARNRPLDVAAANWHALATWAGQWLPEPASILIDIGSTTTDLIPLRNGLPAARGHTDVERLMAGELVYSGIRRTPLCALALAVPFRQQYCPVAAEWFATTLDVYLMQGKIPEDPTDMNTANGRPATIDAAHDRLARMLCCDRTEFSREEAETVADFFANVQKRRLQAALTKVAAAQPVPFTAALISGSGAFLAKELISEAAWKQKCTVVDLAEKQDPGTAEAACAAAVAHLAAERLFILVLKGRQAQPDLHDWCRATLRLSGAGARGERKSGKMPDPRQTGTCTRAGVRGMSKYGRQECLPHDFDGAGSVGTIFGKEQRLPA